MLIGSDSSSGLKRDVARGRFLCLDFNGLHLDPQDSQDLTMCSERCSMVFLFCSGFDARAQIGEAGGELLTMMGTFLRTATGLQVVSSDVSVITWESKSIFLKIGYDRQN